MAKNKVFIGYDECDKAAKDRLLGWDVNKEFDFSSYDRSVDVAVDSEASGGHQTGPRRAYRRRKLLAVHRRQRELPKRLDGMGNPQGS